MKREAVAQHLAIKMETREESVVLHLMGRLDGSGAGEVGCRLEALGRHRAVLDFSRVEAVEPFGARVLGIRLKRLRAAGMRAELEGLSQPVAHELCMGGVLEAADGA